MINLDDLYIVNYCHPNSTPLKNIMRLPKEQAFALARHMANSNKDTTAYGRFADFENYYPLRLQTDNLLYDTFVSLGGNPKSRHPLFFVLHKSDYLEKWYECGASTKMQLKHIPSEFICFTYGDNVSTYSKKGAVQMLTKEEQAQILRSYKGTFEDFVKEIGEK